MRLWFLNYLQVSDLIDKLSLQALYSYPKDMDAGPPRGNRWVGWMDVQCSGQSSQHKYFFQIPIETVSVLHLFLKSKLHF